MPLTPISNFALLIERECRILFVFLGLRSPVHGLFLHGISIAIGFWFGRFATAAIFICLVSRCAILDVFGLFNASLSQAIGLRVRFMIFMSPDFAIFQLRSSVFPCTPPPLISCGL